MSQTNQATGRELEPCPFCGSHDVANVSAGFAGPSNHFHAGDQIFAVNCRACGASVPNRYKNDLVVAAWNRRTSLDTQTGKGEWLPIESAPKDGESILLGYAGSHVGEGRWMGDASSNHWREVGWFEWSDDVLCDHPSRPSHWQPLPTPPASMVDVTGEKAT